MVTLLLLLYSSAAPGSPISFLIHHLKLDSHLTVAINSYNMITVLSNYHFELPVSQTFDISRINILPSHADVNAPQTEPERASQIYNQKNNGCKNSNCPYRAKYYFNHNFVFTIYCKENSYRSSIQKTILRLRRWYDSPATREEQLD